MTLSVRCFGSHRLKPKSNTLITCTALREVDHGWSYEIPRYMILKISQVDRTLGFLKRNFWVNLSTLKAKAYKGPVHFQVEYC